MSNRVRYYLDTEFIERPGLLDLISVGVVCEDGRELYAVSSEFAEHEASEWVRVNVLAKLGNAPRETRADIRARLLAFVGGTRPEFWGYFADYDWVLLCWLFGPMIDLPNGWPFFCLDLKQEMHARRIAKEDLPPQPSEAEAHDALVDARWIRRAHEALSARNDIERKAWARLVRAERAFIGGTGSLAEYDAAKQALHDLGVDVDKLLEEP